MVADMLPVLALVAAMTCDAAQDGSAIQCEPELLTIEATPPEPVDLGMDCSEQFVVGLPDDLPTECEGEIIGR